MCLINNMYKVEKVRYLVFLSLFVFGVNITAAQQYKSEYVCYNDSITVSITQFSINYDYKWETNTKANGWQTAQVGSYKSLKIKNIVDTIRVRCVCDTGNKLYDDTLYDGLVIPYAKISAGLIGKDDTICYAARSKQLTFMKMPSGGGGSYRYLWESAYDSVTFRGITGVTNNSYTSDTLLSDRYFRVVVVSTLGCSSDTTNIIKVDVLQQFVAGSVNGQDTVCFHTAPQQLIMKADAKGGSVPYLYQWQSSKDGVNYNDVSGATGVLYQPGVLDTTMKYRLKYTSGLGCGVVYSSPVEVYVYAKLSAGTLGQSRTLCYGDTSVFSVRPYGGGDKYGYQWEYSFDSISFKTISGATANTYFSDTLTTSRYYRVTVISAIGCSSDTTGVVKINVLNPFVAGSVSGSDTVCHRTAPRRLTMLADANGGSLPYLYQWQGSSDGVTYSNISGATGVSYQPGALHQTMKFRLQFSSGLGCGVAYSSPVEVFVYDSLRPATTSPLSLPAICYGTRPDTLRVTSSATGGNGLFATIWQRNDGAAWQDIPGATGSLYYAPSLTDTTLFRLASISDYGCGTVYSVPLTVNVYAKLSAGTAGQSRTLCYGDTSVFNVHPSGGGDKYGYQWECSYDSLAFKAVAGAISNMYASDTLMSSRFFRVVVTSALGCSSDTTGVVKVNVLKKFLPGSISGWDTVCYHTAPHQLRLLADASGGSAPYLYQWQCSQDGATFGDISGATGISYQPSVLDTTVKYRLKYTSGMGCGVAYSSPVEVLVYDSLRPAVLGPASIPTVCYGTHPDTLRIAVAATGGNGLFTTQWQWSDGTVWNTVPGISDSKYCPDSLTDTTLFRVVNVSDYGCGTVYSTPLTVNVYEKLSAGVVGKDQKVCYGGWSDSLSFWVMPTGGGDVYQYVWECSSDSVHYAPMPGVTGIVMPGAPLFADQYFRVVVFSAKGCSSDTTNVVRVMAMKKLESGSITSGVQEVCYLEDANKLELETSTKGGAGNYTYQWSCSEDSLYWRNVDSANSTEFTPRKMTSTTYYRLVTIDTCGQVVSNITKVLVNPLPVDQTIQGVDSVCFNQYEVYYIDTVYAGFSYYWSIDPAQGQIVNASGNPADTVEVLWDKPSAGDGFLLRVVNDRTGCVRENKKAITIWNQRAPDRTVIVRKANTTILVAKAEGDYYYEWGYTDASGREYVVPDQHQRYVQMPHFDESRYVYWLRIYPFRGSTCYSQTVYSESLGLSLPFTDCGQVHVGSSANSVVRIIVDNPKHEIVRCRLFTTLGQCVYQMQWGSAEQMVQEIPVEGGSGIYVVQVHIGNEVFTLKTFVR